MIDVYFVDVNVVDDVVEALVKLLTPSERARAEGYRFPHDRRRSIVARAASRQLLGRYLARDPATLLIDEEEFGKPFLRGREFEFNVSHSGDLVALAFTKETPVGVDVERRRELSDALALAQRYFSAEEVAIVERAADAGEAFFAIWTAKEAIVKASGKGIGSGDLHSFTVPFRDPQLRPVIDGWSVAAIDPNRDGYFAAVAARDGERRIATKVITAGALL
ncbi:MAG TPA: 4'-phosphopantetheinyl transferase superfamily protein [Thermoanaerobaculia bacterium]|jgi:4'-phosphopantetheinyl transferase|nr:4'-phosphopantetheinyl transferase superfamily protein [Thermoanaerobaculia bacterium]